MEASRPLLCFGVPHRPKVPVLRILIYGLPGMGKTTFMHDYIRRYPDQRYFVVDHAEEWTPEAVHWRGKPPELTIINGKGEIPDDFPDTGVFVFREMEGVDVAQLVIDVGHSVYVDDEIDLVAGREGWNDNPIRALVHQGRHIRNADGDITECHILGACRRPQSLHGDLSGQADHVFIFRVIGHRTLERMRQDAHIDSEALDAKLISEGKPPLGLSQAEMETKIRLLPKFHFWAYPAMQFLSVPPIGDAAENSEPVPELTGDHEREPEPSIRIW